MNRKEWNSLKEKGKQCISFKLDTIMNVSIIIKNWLCWFWRHTFCGFVACKTILNTKFAFALKWKPKLFLLKQPAFINIINHRFWWLILQSSLKEQLEDIFLASWLINLILPIPKHISEIVDLSLNLEAIEKKQSGDTSKRL